ncbi:type II toxin-antitoxin system VapC family toxin [Burkholderia sp. 3C]
MIFVDTNVLLDLATDDPVWAGWSQHQLEAASLHGPLSINEVVYAELGVGYARIEALDAFVARAGLRIEPMPRAALFLAGKAFGRYRRTAGAKVGVLPDFFIGAHASVLGVQLLTRDIGRYRTYFPKLALIAPQA